MEYKHQQASSLWETDILVFCHSLNKDKTVGLLASKPKPTNRSFIRLVQSRHSTPLTYPLALVLRPFTATEDARLENLVTDIWNDKHMMI